MKRFLYFTLATLMVVAAAAGCRKGGANSPDGKKWYLNDPDNNAYGFLDLTLGDGKMVGMTWENEIVDPAGTYLYYDEDVMDYSLSKSDDDWVLWVKDEEDVYIHLEDMTRSSGRLVLGKGGAYERSYPMTAGKFQLEKTPNLFMLTYESSDPSTVLHPSAPITDEDLALTNDTGRAVLQNLATISRQFAITNINGEGVADDYKGKEATMTFVFLKKNDGSVSLAEKQKVAAEMGALGVIIPIHQNAPFSRKQMDALPTAQGPAVLYLDYTALQIDLTQFLSLTLPDNL